MVYTQKSKNYVRHDTLLRAIDFLTTRRYSACCVERDYVRRLFDYFNSMDDCKEKIEVGKIERSNINSWELFFDSCVGKKQAQDLVVCYLSGPEPQNDFDELISLGIHPQNIWAFESNSVVFDQAIMNYDINFPQPKLVYGSIEHFFKEIPKKFDIVYIDACGSIPSSQHCLRMISTLLKYHRLNSPGVLITNFACPTDDYKSYLELIARYLYFKKIPNSPIMLQDEIICNTEYKKFKNNVEGDFLTFYGEFITSVIRDLSSIIVPAQRFVNSEYVKIILDCIDAYSYRLNQKELDSIQNNSIYKFFYLDSFIKQEFPTLSDKKINQFIGEMSGIDGYKLGIFNCLRLINQVKQNGSISQGKLKDLRDFFEESNNIFQFLDKPSSNLLLDLIINQLAYPEHVNNEKVYRYMYNAKKTNMFMDLVILDECRYIYEWLPPIDQLKKAFSNVSWQYIFRFSLDGLVKQRIEYNNEFFYQGSVVQKTIEGFESKRVKERLIV